MVSDEELNQHVRSVEREQEPTPELERRIDELESTARCVHNELARRIERTDAESADGDELAQLRERIVGIEERLADIEAEFD